MAPIDPYLDRALETAIQLQQAGKLSEAEALYRQILKEVPRQVETLYFLGCLAIQTHRPELAVDLLRKATALAPDFPEAFCNLGNALTILKQFSEAAVACQQAISLDPDLAEAHVNLGNALKEAGQLDEAIAAYRRAVVLNPQMPELHYNLANALKSKDLPDEAIVAYQKAIELRPDFLDALNLLANCLKQTKRFEEAILIFRRVIALKAEYADAHSNLGVALLEKGQSDEALAALQRAIALKPNNAETYYYLGIALKNQGQLDGAIAAYEQAIALKADFLEAYNNLGNVLQKKGLREKAVAAFRQAIAYKPDSAETFGNLSSVLREMGSFEEAIAACQQAIALDPGFAGAHLNLGRIFQVQGHLDAAIDAYRQAIAIKPDFPVAHCNLGNALKDAAQLDAALDAYRQAMALESEDFVAHSNFVYSVYFHPDYDARAIAEANRQWNLQHAAPLSKMIRPHHNTRDQGRRLRIGYVSPNFHKHCQSFFTMPLFSHHNHETFEIFCYSDVARPDAITGRLQSLCQGWRTIVGLSDAQVAELIREDHVDILVDLTMHMANSRLLVFARKPAPVQVTWLAYPGTTGLTAMDYRLTDPHLDPPGMDESIYSEQTVRLPESFWCFDPLTNVPTVNELPCLTRKRVTFGSLNNFCKVHDGILRLWARVLSEVPDSRLVLLAGLGSHRQRTLDFLQKEGVSRDRVEFVNTMPRAQYLEKYQQLDISLDTLPANGHTTSLDSFWMGVPVIALVGRSAIGRGSLSIVNNLGLPELAARSEEEFVRIARDWALDRPRLGKLRSTLRQRLEQSPLMDGPRFARHIEAAYRQMWQTWCAQPA
jgi:protein O-GlcNAc transferase